jgi:hypothetical protein
MHNAKKKVTTNFYVVVSITNVVSKVTCIYSRSPGNYLIVIIFTTFMVMKMLNVIWGRNFLNLKGVLLK